MNTVTPAHAGAPTRALPGVLAVAAERAKLDLRTFFRRKDAVVFTLLFPVMILVLFGLIFPGEVEGADVRYSQVLLAGILATGVASVSFVNLAISICNERSNGTLKRLSGTPMPKLSYFLGKVALVLVTALLETALVLALGMALFHLTLPSDPGRWLTFTWVFLLGVSACTLLGIAVSSVPRTPDSAGAVVNLPFVGLQFVSGIYIPFSELPVGLRAFASVFPLAWMAQGFRSVFLPDAYLAVEPAHSWQHPAMAAVLGAWCLAGLVLCRMTFRWGTKR